MVPSCRAYNRAMEGSLRPFTVDQTHGILRRPEHCIEASSDSLGWTSLYASAQHEQAYEGGFRSVDDHLIIVHLDGPVTVSRDLDGQRIWRLVQPGGLFILPAKREFSVRLGGPLATLHVYVRASVVREAAAELASGDPDRLEIVPRLGERDECMESLVRMTGDVMRQHRGGNWIADSLAHVLAAQLVRCHSTAAALPGRPVRGLSSAQLTRVVDYMHAHLEESVGLSDMAGAAALSPVHFSRQFKLRTGMTPHRYLLGLRVERAKRLLAGPLSAAEVAFRCGFSHQEHMTRIFGRIAGLTPSAYRRQIGGADAARR